MSVLFGILVTCLVLLVLVLATLWAGAAASLDRRRQHSTATRALPSARDVQGQGLARIDANGLTFRARVVASENQAEGVIMLHGFPQTSAAYEPLLEAARLAGYRAVAFDQRGYSPGARPRERSDYSLDLLIADVLAVADELGFERFHLVGHDWGAAVGWGLVMMRPERVLSWSALSVPHSYAFGEALRTDSDQRRRSLYFLLFRTPLLAEWVIGFARLFALRRIMYRFMPPAHQQEYVQVFAEPGALTGALNWYRAVGLGGTGKFEGAIHVPTLFIWGNRDPAVARRSVELQAQYLQGPNEVVELDAGHWLLEHRTDVVVPAIMRHIGQNAVDNRP